MDVNPHKRFLVPDKSYGGIAKREIGRIAEEVGFTAAEAGKLNIVVSEMTSNLAKHALDGGELLVRKLGKHGVEVVCLDNGPGMQYPLRMMEDGVSTYGSAGEGLGAIKRQSDEFDMFSRPDFGTVILSRIYKTGKQKPSPQQTARHEIGYVLVPKPNETLCGDGLSIIEKDAEVYLLALDGLGHGTHAHEAAQAAIKAFTSLTPQHPCRALQNVHEQIRRTRGAVGLAANISGNSHMVSYCGIGNIAGKMYFPDTSIHGYGYKNIISYNGILGHNVPNTLSDQQQEWGRNNILVLHSDGIRSRWELTKYLPLNRLHATTIAALLYKEHSRGTDDSMVLVCKSNV